MRIIIDESSDTDSLIAKLEKVQDSLENDIIYHLRALREAEKRATENYEMIEILTDR